MRTGDKIGVSKICQIFNIQSSLVHKIKREVMSTLGKVRVNEVSNAARVFFRFHPVFVTNERQVSKKHFRDVKVEYGKLLETLPQKRNRLKSEQNLEVKTDYKENYKKWEQDFLLKNSRKSRVYILSAGWKKTPLFEKEETVINIEKVESKFADKPKINSEFFDLMEDKNRVLSQLSNSKMEQSQTETSKSCTNPENLVQKESSESKLVNSQEKESDTNVNKGYVISKKAVPSDIIVNNMLSFTLYDSTKSGRIAHKKMPEIKTIISFSANEEKDSLILPSVTRILYSTMSEASKKTLAAWKKQMIQEMGLEGFEAYQEDLLKDGHDLHSSIENTLLQKEYKVPERVKPAFQSVQNVLKDISDVSALETHVVHPKLRYRGIVDCVATYRGELCLIDWKKSDKRKDTISSIYDAPTQIASYIGALNADLKYPFEIRKGLIVVAYTNGEEATVHELVQEDLLIYWKAWLKRLQKYFVDSKKT